VRGVAEVLCPPPVTESVDERRENEDVENGMRRRGDEAGAGAGDGGQKGGAQRETAPAPREEGTIQSIFAYVRGEAANRLGTARLPHVVVHVQELDTPEAEH